MDSVYSIIMSRIVPLAIGIVLAASATVPAAQRGQTKRPATPQKISHVVTCAVPLGSGVKSKREFCDVMIATEPLRSVSVDIPAHTGPATLLFDLHAHFNVPPTATEPAQAFERHTASIAIIKPTGEVIDRGALVAEYRTVQNLFDRIAGDGPGGVKVVAPGPALSQRFTLPAGLTSFGIVGTRLEVLTTTGKSSFDTPGRPVAMLSNLRVEFTPR